MSDHTEKTYSQEKLDIFFEELKKRKNKELDEVKKEFGKNKKQIVKTLEKHFFDRTVQPLSEFKNVGEKEEGCSSGFKAEHGQDVFMIKSFLNRTLEPSDKESNLERFRKSFYKGSIRSLELFQPSMSQSMIKSMVDRQWEMVKNNILFDDLNIADFIREYIAGDLYRMFLYDKAPIIELVINDDLPTERFKIYKEGKEFKSIDNFGEQIKAEKKKDNLYLRSKFLGGFATLFDCKEKNEDYRKIKGFEKILAAAILLGEGDIMQPANIGVIEREGKKTWAKIDHGRSFYMSFNNSMDGLSFIQICFLVLRNYGIKIDLAKLSEELSKFIDYYDANKEECEALIEKSVYGLNSILNPEMQFTLRYCDHLNSFLSEYFSYSESKKVFVSSKGNSLDSYFKQRLEAQVGIARNLVGSLKHLKKSEVASYVIKYAFCLFIPTLLTAIFTSGTVSNVFVVAAAVTGTCMLAGIISACISRFQAYSMPPNDVKSCNSEFVDANVKKFQEYKRVPFIIS